MDGAEFIAIVEKYKGKRRLQQETAEVAKLQSTVEGLPYDYKSVLAHGTQAIRAAIAIRDGADDFFPHLQNHHPDIAGRLVEFVEQLKLGDDDAFKLWPRLKADLMTMGVSPQAKGKKKSGKRNINGLMMTELQKGNPECRGWTALQWAKYLKCSKGTIGETPTWKELQRSRQKQAAERAVDRRGRYL